MIEARYAEKSSSSKRYVRLLAAGSRASARHAPPHRGGCRRASPASIIFAPTLANARADSLESSGRLASSSRQCSAAVGIGSLDGSERAGRQQCFLIREYPQDAYLDQGFSLVQAGNSVRSKACDICACRRRPSEISTMPCPGFVVILSNAGPASGGVPHRAC